MTSKQNQSAVPSSLVASLHPALATLEEAMTNWQKALKESKHACASVESIIKTVEPKIWRPKIEAAHDKQEELAVIKASYDEDALHFMSAWLRRENSLQTVNTAGRNLHDAIVSALIAQNATSTHEVHAGLKPIFKARILTAYQMAGEKQSEINGVHSLMSYMRTLENIQSAAFKNFLADLSRLPGNVLYFTEAAAPRKSTEPGLPDGWYANTEMRNVQSLDFTWINDRQPASARLTPMLLQVREAQRNFLDAGNALIYKREHGVNEQRHAESLLVSMHADKNAQNTFYRVDTVAEQVRKQNQCRCEYQSARLEFAVYLNHQRSLVKEVVKTLKESAAETARFISELTLSEQCAAAGSRLDPMNVFRAMCNNCLAADMLLRQWLREIEGLEAKLNDGVDREIYMGINTGVHSGACAQALESEFQAVQDLYAVSVHRHTKGGTGKHF